MTPKKEPVKFVVLLIFWTIPYLFPSFFELLVDTFLVDPFMSKMQPSLFADAIFIVLGCFVSYLFFSSKFIVKRFVDWYAVWYSILLTSFVFVCRFQLFGFHHWTFFMVGFAPAIAFVDVVLIIPLLLLIYKLIPYNVSPPSIKKEFALLTDAHIKSKEQDKLNRKEFAEFIAKYIVNTTSESSFAIGINAKWGDGKTSFQYLISEYVIENDPTAIVINFNPWKSEDEQKIVSDFFEIYADEIGKYDSRLERKILSYGNKLLATNNNWLISSLNDIFNDGKTYEQNFDQINDSLKMVNRKIIVFIDDLDRLNSKEILEVVRIIRNSGNFKNTFFIVGYDQEYIHKAIERHNDYSNQNYLQKIFQVQFDLSAIPPNVIIQVLKDHLIELLPKHKIEIDDLFGYKPTPSQSFQNVFEGSNNINDKIPLLLKNLRDVKRFSNYFSLSFQLVSTEVVFGDYFYVSLIKFKYPTLMRKIIEYEKNS